MPTFVDTRSSQEEVEHLDILIEHAPTLDHPIRVRSRPVPYGVRIALHTHPWAQVAYTSRGVLRVATVIRPGWCRPRVRSGCHPTSRTKS